MSLGSLIGFSFLCMAVYFPCPQRLRWVVLLVFSMAFYAAHSLCALPFLLLTIATTYLGARVIGRIAARERASRKTLAPEARKAAKKAAQARRRLCLFSVLGVNFLILAVLKYADALLLRANASPLGLVLPLGISFYTFQATGYLIDVYNGAVAPEENPFRLALFLSFFPQLIQGPIDRYSHLAPQLAQPAAPTCRGFERGGMLVLWGLFKKLVIADRALPLVETVFSGYSQYGSAVIALGVLAYSLQQYADFSGGIEIVTGLAEMMGISLAPNFRRPYFAVSLGDFWRRWHISLGAWMRDYVFYPFALLRPVSALSKAVKKRFGSELARTLPAALGNLLVFLLVGVWHGISSNYIAWGLYNGAILALSALLDPTYKRCRARLPRLFASRGYRVFAILRTFFIVNIGWFFDRSAYAGNALTMLRRAFTRPGLFQLTDGTLLRLGLSAPEYAVLLLSAAILFVASVMQERGCVIRDRWASLPGLLRGVLAFVAAMLILVFGVWGAGSGASFIYFQF